MQEFLTQTFPRYRRAARQSPFVQSPAHIDVFLQSYLYFRFKLICLDEWRSVEKHSLIALIVILLGNLSPPVAVFLPQFSVPEKSSFH